MRESIITNINNLISLVENENPIVPLVLGYTAYKLLKSSKPKEPQKKFRKLSPQEIERLKQRLEALPEE
jgi:hypothetical protein